MEYEKVYCAEFCPPMDLNYEVARLEKEMITMALEQSKGNASEAARLLGIKRTDLYSKRVKYGFKIGPCSSRGNRK